MGETKSENGAACELIISEKCLVLVIDGPSGHSTPSHVKGPLRLHFRLINSCWYPEEQDSGRAMTNSYIVWHDHIADIHGERPRSLSQPMTHKTIWCTHWERPPLVTGEGDLVSCWLEATVLSSTALARTIWWTHLLLHSQQSFIFLLSVGFASILMNHPSSSTLYYLYLLPSFSFTFSVSDQFSHRYLESKLLFVCFVFLTPAYQTSLSFSTSPSSLTPMGDYSYISPGPQCPCCFFFPTEYILPPRLNHSRANE